MLSIGQIKGRLNWSFECGNVEDRYHVEVL